MADLSAFIERCLDPIPDGVLTDTHYNMLARRARHAAWNKADHYLRYVTLLSEAQSYAKLVGDEPLASLFNGRETLLEAALLVAQRNFIMTPTYKQEHVDRKHGVRKRIGNIAATGRNDFVKPWLPELDRAIAADEAFLAAHPLKRKGGE